MDLVLSPAELALKSWGLPYKRLEYSYNEKGGTRDAAYQLGLDERHVVKSLVFDDANPQGERGLMALISGTCKVSLRKLERLSGMQRLAPASPEKALLLSGYQPGGICPFFVARPMPLFMERALLALNMLYINAGCRGVVIETVPDALVRLGAVPGEFSREG